MQVINFSQIYFSYNSLSDFYGFLLTKNLLVVPNLYPFIFRKKFETNVGIIPFKSKCII